MGVIKYICKEVAKKIYAEYYYITASVMSRTKNRSWLSIYLEEYHDIYINESIKKFRENFKRFMLRFFKVIKYVFYAICIIVVSCIAGGCNMVLFIRFPGILIINLSVSIYLIFLWWYTKGEMFNYFRRD